MNRIKQVTAMDNAIPNATNKNECDHRSHAVSEQALKDGQQPGDHGGNRRRTKRVVGEISGYLTYAGALLAFAYHHGAATTPASTLDLRAKEGGGQLKPRIWVATKAKQSNGAATSANELFANNPRPIAKPNPTQFLGADDWPTTLEIKK